jgi:hypothetical protein
MIKARVVRSLSPAIARIRADTLRGDLTWIWSTIWSNTSSFEVLSLPNGTGPPLCLGNGGARMANKRPKPEEIVSKLRQVEVLMGQGMPRLDAIRQIGVVEQTYYRWRKQYGGMGVDQLKELKRQQKENDRLRRAVSDLTLDKLILTEAAKGNF